PPARFMHSRTYSMRATVGKLFAGASAARAGTHAHSTNIAAPNALHSVSFLTLKSCSTRCLLHTYPTFGTHRTPAFFRTPSRVARVSQRVYTYAAFDRRAPRGIVCHANRGGSRF